MSEMYRNFLCLKFFVFFLVKRKDAGFFQFIMFLRRMTLRQAQCDIFS